MIVLASPSAGSISCESGGPLLQNARDAVRGGLAPSVILSVRLEGESCLLEVGGATVSSNDGSRQGRVGGVAVDKGSDGTVDAGLVAAGGRGPNGAFGAVVGFGPNHSGAAAIGTNDELTRTWSRFA